MSKPIVALCLFALLAVAGCTGQADITVVNNTSSYIEGDFEGSASFGLTPNGRTDRTIDVGSFWKSSSKVDIHVRYHEDWSSFSPIAYQKTFTDTFKASQSYTYELYTNSGGSLSLRMIAGPGSGITAP